MSKMSLEGKEQFVTFRSGTTLSNIMTAVLSTLFNGSSISSNPALVILTDSLLQPGLLLLNQISSSALNR